METPSSKTYPYTALSSPETGARDSRRERLTQGALGLISMALLIGQGTALSLMLRLSRTQPGPLYLPSVAVLYTELIKLGICSAALLPSCLGGEGGSGGALQSMQAETREIVRRSPPMVVPAGLFVLQQVLVIVAAGYLDAVTFQICSQSFKILPTALFAVALLGQHLTALQWASLPVLAAGVVFVTLNPSEGGAGGGAAAAAKGGALSRSPAGDNLLLGLAASSLSGLSSAYAGVYFEKYVKGREGQSLWARNAQLSLYGVPFSLAYALLWDGSALQARGFLSGFDGLAWGVVALQVVGGLIVALVVKYADNILKNFANALSVVATVLLAIPLFGVYPSPWFSVGCAAVMASVLMYGRAAPAGLESVDQCLKSLRAQQWLPTSCAGSRSGKERPAWSLLRMLLLGAASAGLLGAIILATHSPTQVYLQQRARVVAQNLVLLGEGLQSSGEQAAQALQTGGEPLRQRDQAEAGALQSSGVGSREHGGLG